ncbi:MAG: prolyl oligopeptidase family serine peptidase [Acidimicrobiales bacterium]
MLIKPDGAHASIRSHYTVFSSLATTNNGTAVALCHSPTGLPDIAEFHLATGANRIRRRGGSLGIDQAWFAEPESFDFASAGGRQSHALVYPPTGDHCSGTEGELPPLIVIGHGGPTAHAPPQLDLKINYWTSRGFCGCQCQLRRIERLRLPPTAISSKARGIVDVEDCVAVARQLVAAGRVDLSRCAIRGSSAGGLTVLLALATSDLFSAGTSLYGVAELATLATDTHKFEARYPTVSSGAIPKTRRSTPNARPSIMPARSLLRCW